MKALKQASDEVLNEAAARDPFTKKVYDSFRASLENSMRWGKKVKNPTRWRGGKSDSLWII